MRTLAALAVGLSIASLTPGLAGAGGVAPERPSVAASTAPPLVAPPTGWEVRPNVAPTPAGAPTCCGYDALCCERQALVDAPLDPRPAMLAAVEVSALPSARALRVPDDVDAIEGVPAVVALDGRGQPSPWPDGPREVVRVLPPGRAGDIVWRNSWSPFFAGSDVRGMGYGVEQTADAAGGGDVLRGLVAFTSFDAGPAGAVRVDRVIGVLRGSTAVDAMYWEHAKAAPVARGAMHAYVRDVRGSREVVLVLPEVVLDFESRSVEVDGGFFPSRFSRSVAFTTYALPAASGRSGSARFRLFDSEVQRWFSRPPGAATPARAAHFVVSSSQTSVERAPRVRVLERDRDEG